MKGKSASDLPKIVLAAHHMIFEMGAQSNTITMVVYWGMLHEKTIESPEYKG